MIRTLALIKRRPDLDRDTFRDHYERRHVPLALPLLDGLVRYVRHHVERDLFGEVGFDVLTSFWYRDRESVDRIIAKLSSDAGAEVRADELRFMDKAANRFFPVSERTLVRGGAASTSGRGSEPDDETDEHVFVLVSVPPGTSRFEGSKVFARDAWARLTEMLPSVRCARLRDAFPMAGMAPPWDLVLQLAAPPGREDRTLQAWLRGLEREGLGVSAVRTRRFETKLPE